MNLVGTPSRSAVDYRQPKAEERGVIIPATATACQGDNGMHLKGGSSRMITETPMESI